MSYVRRHWARQVSVLPHPKTPELVAIPKVQIQLAGCWLRPTLQTSRGDASIDVGGAESKFQDRPTTQMCSLPSGRNKIHESSYSIVSDGRLILSMALSSCHVSGRSVHRRRPDTRWDRRCSQRAVGCNRSCALLPNFLRHITRCYSLTIAAFQPTIALPIKSAATAPPKCLYIRVTRARSCAHRSAPTLQFDSI